MLKIENKRLVAVGLAMLLMGVTLGMGAVGPVSASHDDGGLLNDVLTDEDAEDEGIMDVVDRETTMAYLSGMSDRLSYTVTSLWSDGPDTTAEEIGDDIADEFNNNSEAYEEYVNERADVSADHEVTEITIDVDDDTSTVYMVSDYNETADELENSEIVAELPEDRDVDDSVTLEGYAAHNAADELAEFRHEFVEPGEDVTDDPAYLSELSAQYGSDIDTTLVTVEVA